MRHVLLLLSWLLVPAYFRAVLLGQAGFAAGDFTEQFHAFRRFALDELRQGRLPPWNPYASAGHPFLADPRSAVLYPPALLNLRYLWSGSFPVRAPAIEAIAYFPAVAAFPYALAYRLTGRRSAATLSALLFTPGGYLTSYPPLQLPTLETATWLPLVLLLLLRASGSGPQARAFAALARLALALAALAGHGQTLLHLGYLSVAFFRFESRRAGTPLRAALGNLPVFAGCAAGGATAQLLPTAAFVALTPRAQLAWQEAATGFDWSELRMAFFPPERGWSPLYVGPTPAPSSGARPPSARSCWRSAGARRCSAGSIWPRRGSSSFAAKSAPRSSSPWRSPCWPGSASRGRSSSSKRAPRRRGCCRRWPPGRSRWSSRSTSRGWAVTSSSARRSTRRSTTGRRRSAPGSSRRPGRFGTVGVR